jgi:hypothetical protein
MRATLRVSVATAGFTAAVDPCDEQVRCGDLASPSLDCGVADDAAEPTSASEGHSELSESLLQTTSVSWPPEHKIHTAWRGQTFESLPRLSIAPSLKISSTRAGSDMLLIP